MTLFPDLPFPPNLTYHLLGDCENNTSLVTALNLQKKISGSIIYRRVSGLGLGSAFAAFYVSFSMQEVEPSVAELRKQMKRLDLRLDLSLVDNQTQEVINRFDKEGFDQRKTFDDVIAELKNVSRSAMLLAAVL